MEYYYFPDGYSNLSSSSSSSMITNTNNMNINGYIDEMYKSATTASDKNDHHQKSKGSKLKLSTDPQSVAARERRHRISERFKILQGMVPGGNKMDTVSMLEAAIQYVKFLKNQVSLHQTMINLARQESGNVLVNRPPLHQQQAAAFCYQQNNCSVPVLQPVMPEYSCFQGQEATPEIDQTYLKYYS